MNISSAPCYNSLLSFGAKNVTLNVTDMKRAELLELSNDVNKAFRARKASVDVPAYKAISPANDPSTYVYYTIKGEPADPVKNPIKEEHLKKLFVNLFILDRLGIYHNDLDTNHVFFSDKGKVEIDCFRYAFDFQNSPKKGFDLKGDKVRRPSYMMPSNEDGFEYANLGEYFSKLPSYQKDEFLKGYLKARSDYHESRAALLIEQGFDPSSKTVRYEELQGKVFKEPSFEVLNYTRDKLELNGKRRAAFTLWDEGGGACGHEINPLMRFNSILSYINALGSAMKLRDEANALSTVAKSEDEQEFFALEKDYADYWVNNLYNDTKDMGEWNFNDNKKEGGHDIFLGCLEDKGVFEEFYREIDAGKSFNENADALNGVKLFYKNLIEDWSPESNKVYMKEYYRRH